MTDNSNQFKKAPPRKKAPVKRVTLSEDTKKAYEEMMQKRDQAQKEYGSHLDGGNRRA